MSKYIISAKKVLDDGTEETYFFDKENTQESLECNGFCIIGVEHSGEERIPPKNFTTAISDLNLAMIAVAIHQDKTLSQCVRLVSLLDFLSPKKEDDDAAD